MRRCVAASSRLDRRRSPHKLIGTLSAGRKDLSDSPLSAPLRWARAAFESVFVTASAFSLSAAYTVVVAYATITAAAAAFPFVARSVPLEVLIGGTVALPHFYASMRFIFVCRADIAEARVRYRRAIRELDELE
jgi:hypothetical protein